MEKADESEIMKPSCLCTYTLEKQADDHERRELKRTMKKKKQKPIRTHRVTGTVEFGICVETSKASADATRLAAAGHGRLRGRGVAIQA